MLLDWIGLTFIFYGLMALPFYVAAVYVDTGHDGAIADVVLLVSLFGPPVAAAAAVMLWE